MSDSIPAFQLFVQIGEYSFSVPADAAVVSPDGVFLSRIRIPEGTAVVLRIRRGSALVALRGVVCADASELGVSVRFESADSAESQILAHMFAADAHSPHAPVVLETHAKVMAGSGQPKLSE